MEELNATMMVEIEIVLHIGRERTHLFIKQTDKVHAHIGRIHLPLNGTLMGDTSIEHKTFFIFIQFG